MYRVEYTRSDGSTGRSRWYTRPTDAQHWLELARRCQDITSARLVSTPRLILPLPPRTERAQRQR